MWHVARLSPRARLESADTVEELIRSTAQRLMFVTGAFCLVSAIVLGGNATSEVMMRLFAAGFIIILADIAAQPLLERHYVVAQVIWQLGLALALALSMLMLDRPEIALLFVFLPLIATATIGPLGGNGRRNVGGARGLVGDRRRIRRPPASRIRPGDRGHRRVRRRARLDHHQSAADGGRMVDGGLPGGAAKSGGGARTAPGVDPDRRGSAQGQRRAGAFVRPPARAPAGRRGGAPGQSGVRRQRQPRIAHAAEHDHRLHRDHRPLAAGVRRQAAGRPADRHCCDSA